MTGGQFYVPYDGQVALGKVTVAIQAASERREVGAEVSVVFNATEAPKFSLPPGFALAIRRTTLSPTSPKAANTPRETSTASAILVRAASRASKDHYVFLGIQPDADLMGINNAIGLLQRKLDEVIAVNASPDPGAVDLASAAHR